MFTRSGSFHSLQQAFMREVDGNPHIGGDVQFLFYSRKTHGLKNEFRERVGGSNSKHNCQRLDILRRSLEDCLDQSQIEFWQFDCIGGPCHIRLTGPSAIRLVKKFVDEIKIKREKMGSQLMSNVMVSVLFDNVDRGLVPIQNLTLARNYDQLKETLKTYQGSLDYAIPVGVQQEREQQIADKPPIIQLLRDHIASLKAQQALLEETDESNFQPCVTEICRQRDAFETEALRCLSTERRLFDTPRSMLEEALPKKSLDHEEVTDLSVHKGFLGQRISVLERALELCDQGEKSYHATEPSAPKPLTKFPMQFVPTPLQLAVFQGDERIVRILLAHGVIHDVDCCYHGCLRLQDIAKNSGHESLCAIIEGFDCDSYDDEGLTPLHRAVVRGDLEAIHYLHSKGVNLNAQSRLELILPHVRLPKAYTPLQMAALLNKGPVAKRLVECGANKEAKAEGTEEAQAIAQRAGFAGVAEIIQAAEPIQQAQVIRI